MCESNYNVCLGLKSCCYSCSIIGYQVRNRKKRGRSTFNTPIAQNIQYEKRGRSSLTPVAYDIQLAKSFDILDVHMFPTLTLGVLPPLGVVKLVDLYLHRPQYHDQWAAVGVLWSSMLSRLSLQLLVGPYVLQPLHRISLVAFLASAPTRKAEFCYGFSEAGFRKSTFPSTFSGSITADTTCSIITSDQDPLYHHCQRFNKETRKEKSRL